MNTSSASPSPSPDTQKMLEALKAVVTQALDKKRRLGQYAVVWIDGKPALIGEDAPKQQEPQGQEKFGDS
jgi:hypothetical protein